MSVIPVRLLLALAVLVGLTSALAWMLPADALARSTFQSPLAEPTLTVTPTLAAARSVTGSAQITSPVAAPSPVPAAPMMAPQQSEKAPGFLPPPTLSAPGARTQPLLPGPGQPLVAPPAPTLAPRATPTGTAQTNEALTLARLIDTGIVALSYLWLCCGVLVLAAATLILIWLARGNRRA